MVVLGRIVAPFGLHGWVRIQPYGDDPQAWGTMPRWWLSADEGAAAGGWQACQLVDCKAQGKGLLACLEGIADRTAAEKLAGLYIGAPRQALPQAGDNEFYWADLIGLAVINLAGENLGRVSSLITTGAHDVLCVSDGQDGERLLPCVATVVKEVDLTGGTIHVAWERDW
jgi:16S rRNA processing protein RimM